MRSAVAAALLVVAVAGTAAAQPGATPPTSVVPQPMVRPGEELSETTALWLSLGGTAASWTLVVVGFKMDSGGKGIAGSIAAGGLLGTLVAPGFGHWYARSYLSRGLGLRFVGIATALAALVSEFFECTGVSCQRPLLPEVLLFTSLGLYAGGTIDDVVTAPGKARRYNHRFQNMAIVPVIRADTSGFAITGRF